MKKTIILLLLACFCLGSASAWNAVGHRIIAEIAYQNLSNKARRQVDNILGKRGMVYTASWADEIKSDTIYPYSHVWHYQNLRAGMTHEDLDYLYTHPTAEGQHLYYALDSLTNYLKTTDKTEPDVLKFVVHLMGDFFQPMHVGHPEDKGGNKTQMRWFGKGANLHSVWDRYLLEYAELSTTEYVAFLTDRYSNDKKAIQKRTMQECIYHIYELQEAIYDYHEKGDNNTYHYAYRFRSDMEESLYTAGIKLAQLLNEIYR